MSATPRSEASVGFQTGVSDVLKFCNSRTGSSNRAADLRCWHFSDMPRQPDNVRSPGQSKHPAARLRLPFLTRLRRERNMV